MLLFGVSWSVFLRHPARQYGVSAQIARLLASCSFGSQYITIGVRSSSQFRSLMAPALPCNFGGAPNVLTTCLGFHLFFLLTRMDTPGRHVRESCLLILPSHFEMPPMLSNGQLVCGAVPGATIGTLCAQCIVGHNSRAHAAKKQNHLEYTKKRVLKSPARNDRPQAK